MKNFSGIVITIFITTFILSACDPVNQAINDQTSATIDWNNGPVIESPAAQSVPDTVAARYQSDADILAVRTINKMDSTQVTIPDKLVTLYYNGLLQMYVSTDGNAKTVTKDNIIHTRDPKTAHQLFITFDHGQKWSDNWKNGNLMTGISDIDNLIKKYDLQYGEYHSYSSLSFDGMILTSKPPLNMQALARKFKDVNEIKNAEPNGNFVDGNDITATVQSDHVTFVFANGSGDCLSGCINKSYWKFDVYQNGSVKFINAWKN